MRACVSFREALVGCRGDRLVCEGREGGREGGEEGGEEEPCGTCQDEEVVDCSNCDGVGSYVTYGRTVQCNGTCPPSLPPSLAFFFLLIPRPFVTPPPPSQCAKAPA